MSRIGQKIIEIPENVEANLSQNEIKLVGPKGESVSYTHLTLPTKA